MKIRRERDAKRVAKSSRATERGIAGHQAAMKALNPFDETTTVGSFEAALAYHSQSRPKEIYNGN
jgi:hypothetical protein